MQPSIRALVVAGLIALYAARLQGAVTAYSASDIANSTDPRPNSNAMAATFDAAAGGLGPLSIIDFESAPVGIFNNLTVATGVSMDGVDYATNDQEIRNTVVGFPDAYWGYNTTSGGANFVQNAAGTLTFTFSTPIQSFGAYIGGTQIDFNDIFFTDGNGAQTVHVPNPSSALGGITFVGFTDAGQSISSVTITSIGDILGVDDVRFGTTVPEPAAAALAGIMLGMMWVRRRGIPS